MRHQVGIDFIDFFGYKAILNRLGTVSRGLLVKRKVTGRRRIRPPPALPMSRISSLYRMDELATPNWPVVVSIKTETAFGSLARFTLFTPCTVKKELF